MAVNPKQVQKFRAMAALHRKEAEKAAQRASEATRRAAFCETMADAMEKELAEGSYSEGTTLVSKQKPSPLEADAAMVFTTSMFTPEHRLNMSKARAPRNRLAALARKLQPPLTLAEVAEKAGISKSTLTQAQKGERPMPTDAGKKIEALTGYPLSSWSRLS